MRNNIVSGDRVRRRLSNGRLSERVGTVQVIYDGETHALVCWESTHARLAYRATRDHVEELTRLVVQE